MGPKDYSSKAADTDENMPQVEILELEDPGEEQDTDDSDDDSDCSEMEPFEDYKLKLSQLLSEIGLLNFDIQPIQHGYQFQNCVYALTSPEDSAEQYVIRIPGLPNFRESDGKCSEIENDVSILGYLKDRLPVPLVKAYSATPDNVLEKPYTIQTRLAGESLNHVYGKLNWAEKRDIANQYIDLQVKLESLRFHTAGTFKASTTMPGSANDFLDTSAPSVHAFDGDRDDNHFDGDDWMGKSLEATRIISDRAGPDLNLLLKSMIDKWIKEELKVEETSYASDLLPLFTKLLAMLEDMKREGFFEDQPLPIVLHHWDLEDRNIMAAQIEGVWKITGIIDWDAAIAVPLPLARQPPVWLWNWSDTAEEWSESFYDVDQYKDPVLSEENKTLKAYFDRAVEKALPGYLEDAYGRGRWLRRVWAFVKEGVSSQYMLEFLNQLLEDWAARVKPTMRRSEQRKSVLEESLAWIRNCVRRLTL